MSLDNGIGITGSGSLARVTFKAENLTTEPSDIIITENSWYIENPDDSLAVSSRINGLVEIK